MNTTAITIPVGAERTVSGLLEFPDAPAAALVLAHGAGAGMLHPAMTSIASGLGRRGIATLRFNFLFVENGSKRPDPAPLARQVVRTAVAEAHRSLPGIPLFAGGKSFGGRMTSQAQADEPLPHVCGLVFLGFPLHPAGKVETKRARHLTGIHDPMLFVQGERDALADLQLMRHTVGALGPGASLYIVAGGNHSFEIKRSSGRTNESALGEALDHAAGWMCDIARSRVL